MNQKTINRLITFLWAVHFTCTLSIANAQSSRVSQPKSTVQFIIRNLGVKVSGSFAAPKGQIRFHPDSLPSARFNVQIEANTIDTGIPLRDKHLKAEDYFDVARHPLLRFESKKITRLSTDTYRLEGLLIIKGTSKMLQFDFSDSGKVLTGRFQINRRDFNIGGSSLTLADDVDVFVMWVR